MLRDDLKNDFDALLPGRSTERGATRRTALKAALGVGYAAAAAPLMAQTAIRTPSDGLTVGRGQVRGRRLQGAGLPRRARRAGPGCPWCWWSRKSSACTSTSPTRPPLRQAPATWRSRPELYARQGDPTARTARSPKLQAEIVSKVPDAQVMADLDGALKWAAANGGDVAQGRHHRLLLGRPHHLAVCRARGR